VSLTPLCIGVVSLLYSVSVLIIYIYIYIYSLASIIISHRWKVHRNTEARIVQKRVMKLLPYVYMDLSKCYHDVDATCVRTMFNIYQMEVGGPSRGQVLLGRSCKSENIIHIFLLYHFPMYV
jgi:hypothetical protein